MALVFTKSTDTQHREVLTSHILAVAWMHPAAIAGKKAPLAVWTALVGEGAPIRATGRSRRGTTLGSVTGKVHGNYWQALLPLPARIREDEWISVQVDLPRHGLNAASDWIPLFPPIVVTRMRWSAPEARRGDILTLSASVAGLKDGVDVGVVIYESLVGGARDKIVEIPTIIRDHGVEVHWAYEYHEDTGRIPTDAELVPHQRRYRLPEYFFTLSIYGTEYGQMQEPDFLRFKDWAEIALHDDGRPVPNARYAVLLADGTELRGQLDADGKARVNDVGPGPYQVMFPDHEDIIE